MLHTKGIIFLFVGSFLVILFSGFAHKATPQPYQYPELRLFPKMVATDNPPTVEGVALGRFLFYDPVLSKDSTFSCGTCHQQKYAFSDAPQAFSRGVNGDLSDRNTMPLFNLAWATDFFWDGKAASLEEQVFHPVRAHKEMDLNWELAAKRIRNSSFYRPQFYAAFGAQAIDSTSIAKAIAQFERTLISHNSKYDQALRGETYFTAKEYQGFELMNDQTKGNCLHCHTTDANVLGTTGAFSNNGLDAFNSASEFVDQGRGTITKALSDIGLFKIPSLRNVALTAPYMHDGRFASLEEVLDFYCHGVNDSFNVDAKMEDAHRNGLNLTKEEKESILDFLHTLTDSVFIQNPEFANPFME